MGIYFGPAPTGSALRVEDLISWLCTFSDRDLYRMRRADPQGEVPPMRWRKIWQQAFNRKCLLRAALPAPGDTPLRAHSTPTHTDLDHLLRASP